MKKALLLCGLIFFVFHMQAQCLAAFRDTRPGSESLYAMEDGKVFRLEYKVVSFQVGPTMIAWVNSMGEFKAYVHGETMEIRSAVNSGFSYRIRNDLLFYSDEVFDGYRSYEMCFLPRNSQEMFDPDDTVGYLQKRKDFIARYCMDEKIYNIYDKLYTDTVYFPFNPGGTVYIAEGDRFIALEGVPDAVKTDKRIAALVDHMGRFKAFYKTEMLDIEEYAPVEYYTGEDFIAYVSSVDDSFKVFYDGKVYPLMYQMPLEYQVGRDALWYFDQRDHLYAFWKGTHVKLANYRPKDIRMGRGIVVFTDLDGRLHGFINGKVVEVSNQVVGEFMVQNKAVVYYKVPSGVLIYCNGVTTRAY